MKKNGWQILYGKKSKDKSYAPDYLGGDKMIILRMFEAICRVNEGKAITSRALAEETQTAYALLINPLPPNK